MFELALVLVLVLAVFFLSAAIRILMEYERGVVFRLGRVLEGAKGPGLIIRIPIVDRLVKVDLNKSVPGWESMSEERLAEKVRAVAMQSSDAAQDSQQQSGDM